MFHFASDLSWPLPSPPPLSVAEDLALSSFRRAFQSPFSSVRDQAFQSLKNFPSLLPFLFEDLLPFFYQSSSSAYPLFRLLPLCTSLPSSTRDAFSSLFLARRSSSEETRISYDILNAFPTIPPELYEAILSSDIGTNDIFRRVSRLCVLFKHRPSPLFQDSDWPALETIDSWAICSYTCESLLAILRTRYPDFPTEMRRWIAASSSGSLPTEFGIAAATQLAWLGLQEGFDSLLQSLRHPSPNTAYLAAHALMPFGRLREIFDRLASDFGSSPFAPGLLSSFREVALFDPDLSLPIFRQILFHPPRENDDTEDFAEIFKSLGPKLAPLQPLFSDFFDSRLALALGDPLPSSPPRPLHTTHLETSDASLETSDASLETSDASLETSDASLETSDDFDGSSLDDDPDIQDWYRDDAQHQSLAYLLKSFEAAKFPLTPHQRAQILRLLQLHPEDSQIAESFFEYIGEIENPADLPLLLQTYRRTRLFLRQYYLIRFRPFLADRPSEVLDFLRSEIRSPTLEIQVSAKKLILSISPERLDTDLWDLWLSFLRDPHPEVQILAASAILRTYSASSTPAASAATSFASAASAVSAASTSAASASAASTSAASASAASAASTSVASASAASAASTSVASVSLPTFLPPSPLDLPLQSQIAEVLQTVLTDFSADSWRVQAFQSLCLLFRLCPSFSSSFGSFSSFLWSCASDISKSLRSHALSELHTSGEAPSSLAPAILDAASSAPLTHDDASLGSLLQTVQPSPDLPSLRNLLDLPTSWLFRFSCLLSSSLWPTSTLRHTLFRLLDSLTPTLLSVSPFASLPPLSDLLNSFRRRLESSPPSDDELLSLASAAHAESTELSDLGGNADYPWHFNSFYAWSSAADALAALAQPDLRSSIRDFLMSLAYTHQYASLCTSAYQGIPERDPPTPLSDSFLQDFLPLLSDALLSAQDQLHSDRLFHSSAESLLFE